MKQLRNRHFFLSDLILLAFACYLSYVLRLEALNIAPYWASFFLFSALALFVTPWFFWKVGLYARYWRYASVDELLLLTGTVTISALLIAASSFISSRLLLGSYPVPRSIPFLFLLLALAMTAGPRLIMRLMIRYNHRQSGRDNGMPVLIMGAGDVGTMIVRELQNKPHLSLEVVGFLDDDPLKQEMYIYGVPVLGKCSDLSRVIQSYHVRQVILAMPTAPGKMIRQIVTICEQVGVETRIIPAIYELLNGTVSVSQLREVDIEDLLRREPVQINTTDIQALIRGRRAMVTGGGGSIGSELCRQIANFQPDQLILLDHGENSVFYIEKELSKRFPELSIRPVIADIRNRTHLNTLIQSYRPEIIFHAAAHKHVPLMESNPCEAIMNNVLGTKNLVELAAQHQVGHLVMISTDKAVNPTSVMGASKRCAECILLSVARASGRPYVAVRFGNVLGSSGSVVPIFKQQIAAGGPVTITHPEMRRFFMTIPEAVQLVLQAATLGKGGEVFVLDMGQPVRIVDLARDLITLSGLRPDEDIEITFSGIRPGEKLFEELFIEGETYQRTRHQKIFMGQSAAQITQNPKLWQNIERLITAAQARNDKVIRPLLQQTVPEYQPKKIDHQHSTPRPQKQNMAMISHVQI